MNQLRYAQAFLDTSNCPIVGRARWSRGCGRRLHPSRGKADSMPVPTPTIGVRCIHPPVPRPRAQFRSDDGNGALPRQLPDEDGTINFTEALQALKPLPLSGSLATEMLDNCPTSPTPIERLDLYAAQEYCAFIIITASWKSCLGYTMQNDIACIAVRGHLSHGDTSNHPASLSADMSAESAPRLATFRYRERKGMVNPRRGFSPT